MTDNQARHILHRAKSHVIKTEISECHIWQGPKNQANYGLIEYRDKITKKRHSLLVHRIYYSLHHRIDLSRSDFICHTCDNPSCVNIEHLYLGNAQTNSKDRISRNRYAKSVTYHHRIRKYTDEQVAEVKRLLKDPDIRMRTISEITGVNATVVSEINIGRLKRDPSETYPIRQHAIYLSVRKENPWTGELSKEIPISDPLW